MIESQLGDESRTITEAQAMQISQTVKLIAMIWSKESGGNQYGAVYGRLYELFDVTSYKLLPALRFVEVMSWLKGWYQDLNIGPDVPF